MSVAAALILLAQAPAPMVLQPFAQVNVELPTKAWGTIEKQDAAAFSALLAPNVELILDRDLVEGGVGAFASTAAQCDLASKFEWVSNVLGPTAPYEAKLTCVGAKGHQKTVTIYFDSSDKIVAMEVNEPIVVKF